MRELRPRHRPLKHKHQSSSVVLAGCEQLMRHVEWERLCSRARFSCTVRGFAREHDDKPALCSSDVSRVNTHISRCLRVNAFINAAPHR